MILILKNECDEPVWGTEAGSGSLNRYSGRDEVVHGVNHFTGAGPKPGIVGFFYKQLWCYDKKFNLRKKKGGLVGGILFGIEYLWSLCFRPCQSHICINNGPDETCEARIALKLPRFTRQSRPEGLRVSTTACLSTVACLVSIACLVIITSLSIIVCLSYITCPAVTTCVNPQAFLIKKHSQSRHHMYVCMIYICIYLQGVHKIILQVWLGNPILRVGGSGGSH